MTEGLQVLCLLSSTDDQMKHMITFSKIMDFSGSDIIGNILDNVNMQLNKIYKEDLVVFSKFTVKCNTLVGFLSCLFQMGTSQIKSVIGLKIYSITL